MLTSTALEEVGPIAGSKSDYLEKIVLDLFLGASAYSTVTPLYIALSTAAYSDAATGTSMTEVSGGSYARVSHTNNSTNWPNASGTSPATKANGAVFTFPTATAGWGTILSFYIVDATSAGNILYGADLSTSKSILTGDTATFAIGAITITED